MYLPPFYTEWFKERYPNIPLDNGPYCIQSTNSIQVTKDAGNRWYTLLCKVLITSFKCIRNSVDHSIFRLDINGETVLLEVSTDDILCTTSNSDIYWKI